MVLKALKDLVLELEAGVFVWGGEGGQERREGSNCL